MSSGGQQTARYSGAVCPAAVRQCSRWEAFGLRPCGSGPNGSRLGRRRVAVLQTGAIWPAAMRKWSKWEADGPQSCGSGPNGSRLPRCHAEAGQNGAVWDAFYAELVENEPIAI